jgi:hypothetical protein
MGCRAWLAGLICLWAGGLCVGQNIPSSENQFSRANGWTVFAEYSNTSSHILMGASRERKLATLGGAYTRRVVRFWGSQLNYQVEVRPVIFESDPLAITTSTYTVEETGETVTATQTTAVAPVFRCEAASGSYTFPPTPGVPPETVTYDTVCGRQWTFAQAFSPLGFKYSMLTHHRVQPFIIGTLGYMYSSRAIPVAQAEAFNFEFDFGPGIEIYEKNKRSVSVECRFHHFSNRDTAEANPGVDNLMYKVSYSFGR